ncbi:MAG TPA: hypothetical protein VGV13_06345 [Methylomirabilota bacterium]|jgi:hypothetical protein|nr:hypothetical protein [Methylomirabilota bacterium]
MRKSGPRQARSRKAGRPPAEVASSPQVRRRRKTARVAVRKDTMLSQAAEGPRVRWAAGKPREKKR